MSSVLRFLYRQFFITPELADASKVNLSGQCGIVTGSNVGLGFEASRQLLDLGLSKLILAVRSIEKGEAARKILATEHPTAEILVWEVDMSSYQSIQAFAERCRTLPQVNFAILNAGIAKFAFEKNPSTGHEETIQVNLLSTCLLASLLLPVLSKTKGNITIVGSETAEWSAFKERKSDQILAQCDQPKGYDATDRYYTSKLLQEYFVIEAAKRIDSDKVVLNTVNPGFCYGSSLHREAPGMMGRVLAGMKRAIGRTTAVGARPIVKAAVVESKASHGQYYSDNAVRPMAPLTQGETGRTIGGRLWKEIVEELRFADIEGIMRNLGTTI